MVKDYQCSLYVIIWHHFFHFPTMISFLLTKIKLNKNKNFPLQLNSCVFFPRYDIPNLPPVHIDILTYDLFSNVYSITNFIFNSDLEVDFGSILYREHDKTHQNQPPGYFAGWFRPKLTCEIKIIHHNITTPMWLVMITNGIGFYSFFERL